MLVIAIHNHVIQNDSIVPVFGLNSSKASSPIMRAHLKLFEDVWRKVNSHFIAAHIASDDKKIADYLSRGELAKAVALLQQVFGRE